MTRVDEHIEDYTVKELKARLRDEFPHVVRNFGQHFHRATKRDLAVALVAAEQLASDALAADVAKYGPRYEMVDGAWVPTRRVTHAHEGCDHAYGICSAPGLLHWPDPEYV